MSKWEELGILKTRMGGWKQFPKHIGKREKHNEKEYKSKGRGGAESVVFYGVLIM